METARPPSDKIQVVSWNHSGGAAGCSSAAALTGAAAVRVPGDGRPLPRPPLGRLPCRGPVAVALASGRPPRVPLSRDLVPPPAGLAVVPGLRAAITARSSRR